jgi:hypothetical protein
MSLTIKYFDIGTLPKTIRFSSSDPNIEHLGLDQSTMQPVIVKKDGERLQYLGHPFVVCYTVSDIEVPKIIVDETELRAAS